MKGNNSYNNHYILIVICCLFFYMHANAQQFRRIETQANLREISNNNGIAVADYDLDNDLDIFIVGEATFNNNDPKTWSRLLKNNNDGSFDDVTIESGFAQGFDHDIEIASFMEVGDKLGASWGDYDNDGYPDIFLSNALQSQLYHNNGDGTFTNVTSTVGIVETCTNCYFAGALWLDINNDSFLDLYISDYSLSNDNKLYQNNGNGSFTLISDTNIGGNANSFSAIPIDANNDAYIDLYVANDFDQNNFLLLNQNGNGFIEAAAQYGVENPFDGMGLATCDYDNNGLFDFLVTNIKQNEFFVNTGNGFYEKKAESLGIYDTKWAWGAVFSDFNHDGFEDLYIANGFSNRVPNSYFENVSSFEGRNFQEANLTDKPIENSLSRSTVSFDYDNDGDLDLIVSDFESFPFFYENTSTDPYYTNEISGSWLKLKLEGTVSNKNAIGAKIALYHNNGQNQFRFNHGSGYQSQSIKPEHFGLANSVMIDSLSVIWPMGSKEVYYNISVNKTIKIIEGSGLTIENNNTAVKIPGCTIEDSCNYNPNATTNDGTCTFLEAGSISGSSVSSPLTTEAYNYSPSFGDGFEWTVTNGEIVGGQGTNTISVLWNVGTQGVVSVVNRNEVCVSEIVSLEVSLEQPEEANKSVARLWNEALLQAIRNDFARPTVHARNLFHTSIAMYDAWAIHNKEVQTYFIGKEVNGFRTEFNEFVSPTDTILSLNKTISYAAYRILKHRFRNSPNAETTLFQIDDLMALLDYDTNITSTDYSDGDPAALGNYIGTKIIEYGLQDGSNEANDYANLYYQPVNDPLAPAISGNSAITDPNRWQPLALEVFIDQSGNLIRENTPDFLSPEWGNSSPFALNNNVLTNYTRESNTYRVYHDPGDPPYIGMGDTESSNIYKWGFSLVSVWGSHLSPDDGVLWDISPNSIGNISSSLFPTDFANYDNFYNTIDGGDIGEGHALNPITNTAYISQLVPRGDYARVLAEFWADGPDSETPPGHWFVLLNYVNDNPLLEKRMKGEGEILSDLEWDIKSYFILGGAMHDSAIASWGIKGWYDYIRPISAIRYMADMGQSSDSSLNNYHENGIPLMEGFIEVVEANDELAGPNGEHIGKIKAKTWRGHDYIDNPETDAAGVGWILIENWWPYQRPSFVTPPFAGYVSGHSTYSRAAAEVLTKLTGTEFFPGGMGEFLAEKNEFLVFEEGPSQDVTLQWATYRDASDQCSLSRIWGGIHPPMDDIPGRIIGENIGVEAFNFAETYFNNLIDIDSGSEMAFYPNPVNRFNEITVTNSKENQEFLLFDLLGKLIPLEHYFIKENNSSRIQIGNLSSGVYILKSNNSSWKVIIK